MHAGGHRCGRHNGFCRRARREYQGAQNFPAARSGGRVAVSVSFMHSCYGGMATLAQFAQHQA